MPLAANIYYHLYEENGKLPVVLIHGAGGSHLSWPSEMRRVPGYSIYAVDLPGHGKSPGSCQQTIQGYTQVLLDWLHAAGLQSAVFAGHSLGGAIALKLAVEYPQHVLGLVLIGSASRLKVNQVLLEHAANPATYHQAIEMIISWSFDRTAPPNLIRTVAKRLGEVRSSVLYSDLMACDSFDLTEQIAKIESPTRVICGVHDRMTPPRQSRFLAETIAQAELDLIEDAGHMVMLEQVQACARSLVDFLNKIPYP